ncbi:1,3-beta-glucanosyltransferase gas1 [Cladophialophora chaetospira]|uniref:1,3-beta-glucanosyltransferase gas1 n=1 Tax=Cladophialophora chaetospira TaxID=386627 RepID=A0AA38XMX1_9EURO|nr:1,3-beta-glucanosyltransferase gas1 [Cladophialophora chaetospira]
MVAYSTLITLGLLAAAELVAGHGAIIAATGDAGGQGSALGIDPDTPRDGTRRRPFQQDTTRFQGNAADTVGETLAGGDNDIETGTAAVLAQNGGTLPQITPGGEVQMTLHQVNADGAGPYTCMINDDGTATSWTQMTVTQQVPGRRGNDRDGAETDFPLTASVPADQTCTGTVAGEDNVCLVRCQNPARAGPFGGVVPVQMASTADTAATATNGTATADSTATAAASSTALTGDAEDIAAADDNANGVSANEQAAANAADDKRKAKRSSRVERRSAAAVSYRHAVKFRA